MSGYLRVKTRKKKDKKQLDNFFSMLLVIAMVYHVLALNSFQKWLRILIWLIIPMNFQNLLPVSYLSASAAKVSIAAEADK